MSDEDEAPRASELDRINAVLADSGTFTGVDEEFARWAREAIEARHRRPHDADD